MLCICLAIIVLVLSPVVYENAWLRERQPPSRLLGTWLQRDSRGDPLCAIEFKWSGVLVYQRVTQDTPGETLITGQLMAPSKPLPLKFMPEVAEFAHHCGNFGFGANPVD